ncbi:small subunit ribosomal protein S20 [Pullulanibacillus pueri]|uniref:Small ribosomal subunit protein bS20 n=1 Tax=Pullulanibacillus pueri TaxID=1437324 RepID=A0A8J2ZXA1_9BACL|nr:30S ribosomal protein S20 [Pullulanibacillus pueri]MBM7683066.1 small subunit ribosomal protein S20 [Pullulanibacillus pueri]GGH84910.1 30S ribosomal protein S20 [Pullulanibacillus pueri]
MPNIQSAIKRVKKSETSREQNQSVKSAMRSSIKSFNNKVEEKDVEGAKAAFLSATQKLDKAVNKGLIHKNKAAREKARLNQKLNEVNA